MVTGESVSPRLSTAVRPGSSSAGRATASTSRGPGTCAQTASAIRRGARPLRDKGTVFAQYLSIGADPRRERPSEAKWRRERLAEPPRELRAALRLSAPAYPNAREQ